MSGHKDRIASSVKKNVLKSEFATNLHESTNTQMGQILSYEDPSISFI